MREESSVFGTRARPFTERVCAWLLKKIEPNLGVETSIMCACCGVVYRIAFDIHAMIEGAPFRDCVSLIPFPKRNSVAN